MRWLLFVFVGFVVLGLVSSYSPPVSFGSVNFSLGDGYSPPVSFGSVNITFGGVSADTIPPTWNETPFNISLGVRTPLSVRFNASDETGLSGYVVSDSVNFSMGFGTGVLSNATTLFVSNYSLVLSVNDTSNNVLNASIYVDVFDDVAPSWDEVPFNVTIGSTVGLLVDFNASDETGLDSYFLDDSENFSVNASGFLSNATTLFVSNYSLVLSVNDTSNNVLNASIYVDVFDDVPPTFDEIPPNLSVNNITGVIVDFNASDETSTVTFGVNDTNFSINASGFLLNASGLGDANYTLNVSISDVAGNENSLVFLVEVESSGLLPVSFSVLSPIGGLVAGDVVVRWENTSSSDDSGGVIDSFNVTLYTGGLRFLGVLNDSAYPMVSFVWGTVGNDWGDGDRVVRVVACDTNGYCRVSTGGVFEVRNTVPGGEVGGSGGGGSVGRLVSPGNNTDVLGVGDDYVVYRRFGSVLELQPMFVRDNVLVDADVSRALVVGDSAEFEVELVRVRRGVYDFLFDFAKVDGSDFVVVFGFDDTFRTSRVLVSDESRFSAWFKLNWGWFLDGLSSNVNGFRVKTIIGFLSVLVVFGGVYLLLKRFVLKKGGVVKNG